MRPYNGLKVLVAGMGPRLHTSHHLLMEGFAVVGTEGLKIEPLARELIDRPVRDWATLEERLDERVMAGFGGVAEYGITVRWDKNFLKLIYSRSPAARPSRSTAGCASAEPSRSRRPGRWVSIMSPSPSAPACAAGPADPGLAGARHAS